MTSSRGGVLFVAFRFPPDGGVGCLRNYKMALSSQRYKQSYVLTSAYRHYPSTLESESATDVIVHKVSNWDIKSIIPPGFRQKIKGYKFWSSSLHSSVRQDFLEGGPGYVRRAMKTARKLIHSESIRSVYSSFQPTVDHKIARQLKAEFPHLRWICDFRDYPGMLSTDRSAIERRVFDLAASADVLLASTQGLQALVERQTQRTCLVLYSGLNPYRPLARPLVIEEKGETGSDKVILTYAGSLYGQRPLDAWATDLDSLREKHPQFFARIQLQYIGLQQDVWWRWVKAHNLEGYSISRGAVSFRESLRMMDSSDILIYLDYGGQVQGVVGYKWWDYLSTAKAIVLYTDHDTSEIQDFEPDQYGVYSSLSDAMNSSHIDVLERQRLLRELDDEIDKFWRETAWKDMT